MDHEGAAGCAIDATAFRYPADDPHTAEPTPDKTAVGRRLARVEAFIAAVETRIIRSDS